MDCLSCELNCGNYKENEPTYYCIAKNQVLINNNYKPSEKTRTGWKKGTLNYEKHRRLIRQDIEDI